MESKELVAAAVESPKVLKGDEVVRDVSGH